MLTELIWSSDSISPHETFEPVNNGINPPPYHIMWANPAAEYGLEAHPIPSDEFTIPDDFLNTGVWFRRTYRYSASDLDELLISLTELGQSIKHDQCCFICHDYDKQTF